MKYIYVYSINTPVIKRSPAGSPAGTSRVYLHASSGCGKERNHNKEKIWLVVLDILKRDASTVSRPRRRGYGWKFKQTVCRGD